MGEESIVPGSATLALRRCATLAAVMPVAPSLASLRAASSPNSGQSTSRGPVPALVATGIASGLAEGVAMSAGVALPHAASTAHASAVHRAAAGRAGMLRL